MISACTRCHTIYPTVRLRCPNCGHWLPIVGALIIFALVLIALAFAGALGFLPALEGLDAKK